RPTPPPARPPSTPLFRSPGGELVPVSTFTRIETSTAPRTLNRFQQRNAVRVFGGVQPGVTKEEGLRVLEAAAEAAGGPSLFLDRSEEHTSELQSRENLVC